MQQQAAVKIDREIGGTDTQMPNGKLKKHNIYAPTREEKLWEMIERVKGKIRKKEYS